MVENTEENRIEYSDEIIARYKEKGLDVDATYTPITLAKLQIIPTFRGIPACHQYIRKIARSGDLKSSTQGGSSYQKRLIKGVWVLDYLKKYNLL